MSWQDYIPEVIQNLYEIYDYKHAAAIIAREFPQEFADICSALTQFRISRADIASRGGNESDIPKRMSEILRPLGWNERNLAAELSVYEMRGQTKTLKNTVQHGTHKVDYLKNRVAFDLEWNSKDQTFDRDLYAFRAFFEYDAISVGILGTRSNALDSVFRDMDLMHKYGASTTHINKLIPRLEAGRNGGCPILVFGITDKLLV